MTDTPIFILQKAADLGLRLGVRPGDKLTVQPIERCPTDFVERLREHKMDLLIILQWPFVMAYSAALGETIFACEDEVTKAALVEAGADEWNIYTKDELCVLIAHNRAKPFLPDELCKVHEIKRAFNERISK